MKNIKEKFRFKLTYLNLIHRLSGHPHDLLEMNHKCYFVPRRVSLFAGFGISTISMYFEDDPNEWYYAGEINSSIGSFLSQDV